VSVRGARGCAPSRARISAIPAGTAACQRNLRIIPLWSRPREPFRKGLNCLIPSFDPEEVLAARPFPGLNALLRSMNSLGNLSVKIFADGADLEGMFSLYRDPLIKGLTTNPTLMRKAGIEDYEAFAKDVLQMVKTKSISFEVFSDDFPEMRRQALKIRDWQENVFVKIPITNTRSESSIPLIKELAAAKVPLNITAILTLKQVRDVTAVLNPNVPAIVSVFAGRIADTGKDPEPAMRASKALLADLPKAELLWASVREVLNIIQADNCGCDIVTVPHDILKKAMTLFAMDLEKLSLDTVKMFAKDAELAGFTL
jgi:transaldolase